jgi:MFS family permease
MVFERSTGSVKDLGSEYKSVIKNPRVIMLCTAGFLTFFSLIGVISFTVDFASKPPLALREYQLGIILASSGLAQIILALPGGLIVDWIGRARTAFMGFSLGTVIAFMFIYANSYIHYVVLATMIGFASVLIWAVLVTLSVEIIPERKIYVTSLFNSLRFFGFAAGPVLLVGIYTGISINAVYLICTITFAVNLLLLKSITSR